MATKIFVNRPVKDLKRSIEFFTKLGFSFNEQFTDDKAACLVLGENLYSMLITEPFFKTFTKKEIADASKITEVLICLDVESREKVDELAKKAVEAGGSLYREPQDHGWMYYQCFADLDGHQWEVMYADETQVPSETAVESESELQP